MLLGRAAAPLCVLQGSPDFVGRAPQAWRRLRVVNRSLTDERGKPGARPGFRIHSDDRTVLPALRTVPVVNVLAHLVLGEAVALLDFAFQLLAPAGDDVEIVVGELAPLLLDLALDLLPVPFHAVPVHVVLLIGIDSW